MPRAHRSTANATIVTGSGTNGHGRIETGRVPWTYPRCGRLAELMGPRCLRGQLYAPRVPDCAPRRCRIPGTGTPAARAVGPCEMNGRWPEGLLSQVGCVPLDGSCTKHRGCRGCAFPRWGRAVGLGRLWPLAKILSARVAMDRGSYGPWALSRRLPHVAFEAEEGHAFIETTATVTKYTVRRDPCVLVDTDLIGTW